jgi:hypothetical protein
MPPSSRNLASVGRVTASGSAAWVVRVFDVGANEAEFDVNS